MSDKQPTAPNPAQLLQEFLIQHGLTLSVYAIGKTGSPHNLLDFIPDGFQVQIVPIRKEEANAPS